MPSVPKTTAPSGSSTNWESERKRPIRRYILPIMVKRFAARLRTSFVEAPWSLKLLLVYEALWSLIAPAVSGVTLTYALLPLSALFLVLWLLRLRWFWWFSVVSAVIMLILDPVEGRSAWLLVLAAVDLVLVLWPSTYTYVTRRPLPSWAVALAGQTGKPPQGP